MLVDAQPPDDDRFAPFGVFIDGPGAPGERQHHGELLTTADDRALQFHVNHLLPSTLPLRVEQMERHPDAVQVFLPLDVARYLVTVAPPDAHGAPDLGGALCFLLPGSVGVAYHANAWHGQATVLDRVGRFAVLMRRGGANDDVFVDIPTLTIGPGQ
ncbi:MAG: ureidoglycolate lyase [Pseudomonadota bacterium]